MNTTTVTARPCGKDRHGNPIAERIYVITCAPEPFGEGKSRLWGVCEASRKHGLDRRAPLAVVHTDSIKVVSV